MREDGRWLHSSTSGLQTVRASLTFYEEPLSSQTPPSPALSEGRETQGSANRIRLLVMPLFPEQLYLGFILCSIPHVTHQSTDFVFMWL